MSVQQPAPTRRMALAKAMEDAAVDADALAQRLASMDGLPKNVAAYAEGVKDAARVLCHAAMALHGGPTDTLNMFFDLTGRPPLTHKTSHAKRVTLWARQEMERAAVPPRCDPPSALQETDAR